MVPDKHIKIFFSDWLRKAFPKFSKRLTSILDDLGIDYSWLPGTQDIWSRDFMPIQIDDTQFIQYKYWPDYLLKRQSDLKYITDSSPIMSELGIHCISTNIILNGGNVVMTDEKAIMTEKPDRRNWAYINFLEAEDFLIIPAIGIDEDAQALEQFEHYFPQKKVKQILMPEIIQRGGALNCISWNITTTN